jgi:uncharacterized protein (DUF302 family)
VRILKGKEQTMQIYRSQTAKPVERFVADLGHLAKANGFLIHNEDEMEMAHVFGRHGVKVAEGFDLHMIQICKPERAAKSLGKNPERSVLMPKFIMTFIRDGLTQIRFVHYSPQTIRALVDDDEFPGSLAESFTQIIAMIEEAR